MTRRFSLIAFLLAFLYEASVDAVLLWSLPLKPTGWGAIIASLTANPLAFVYAMKRRKWAFDLLKWIAAFSIVWTVSGFGRNETAKYNPLAILYLLSLIRE